MERILKKAERRDRHNRNLCILAQQNDLHAQTELLLANEGLVMQLAKSLEIIHDLDINHYAGIELDDILQEGRFALLEAAKSYDVTSGTKFSTYASVVMKNAMNDLCRKGDSSFEKQLVNNGFVLVFLDDNPVDEDGIPECEKVSDSRVRDPAGDEAVLRVQIQKMYNRLAQLSVREQKILNYHYGLISKEYKSISETAAFFHLSEKHMQNIEENALGKLKDGMNDGKIL